MFGPASARGVAARARLFTIAVALAASAIPAGPAAAVDSPVRLFAGVASAPGGNGTQWRSEVVLSNPSESATDVTLEVVPRGETGVTASQNLTLAAGETRRIPDLYAALGIASGAGTLRVKGQVLSWVRTFNQGATGTFGQDVPPVGNEPAFAAVTPVFFPINTPADSKTDFRSNLLLLNSGTTPLTFTLAAGAASRTYDVPAGVFAQISGVGGWLGLAPGPAILSVSANGGWSGMVSTIDPILGDPTTVRGLVATTRTVTQFSGVASAPGGNGTQWHSEAVLFNPRTSAQNVLLELIPRDGAAPIANVTLPLGPFQQERIPDVYQRFGVGSGAGTMRVTGDVLTWVRTFNQGAGVTFGQDVPETIPGVGNGPTASVSFPITTPADTKTDFRSNFIVYNHEARPVTLTFTAGAVTGTLSVPAGTFTQKNNVGAWLGLSAGNFTMAVTGDGRWSGMVSTIDPFLGDPTTMIGIRTTGNPTPTAQGVPSGSASTATIGPAGGTLASADGRFSLTVPAGALSSPTTFTVQPITNLAWGGIGTAYRLGPGGTTFSVPATLTFNAAAEDTAHISAEGLSMGYQDAEGYWHWIVDAVTDPAARTVRTTLTRIAEDSSVSAEEKVRAGGDALAASDGDRNFSLLSGLVLLPSHTDVKESGVVVLTVWECSPQQIKTKSGQKLTPLVNPCDFSYDTFRASFTWAVNGMNGGNATVGTITDSDYMGAYSAPAKAPSPSTVTASVKVVNPMDGVNVTLLSEITIGGEIRGSFDLDLYTKTGIGVHAAGRNVELRPFLSDENGVAYSMVGIITIDNSFTWFNMTCTVAQRAWDTIPFDAVFSIQKKPSLAQHWVMPAISWNFTCNPGGITIPVAMQFFVAQPGDCSQAVWLPLADEKRPTGSYTDKCNPAFTVNGSWYFGSN